MRKQQRQGKNLSDNLKGHRDLHENMKKLYERLKRHWKKPKKQIKDNVFRLIFGKDKEALLQLYNALNGTELTNPEELQIVTLESAIYVGRKNDVAYLLAGRINLYEHQSTVNPNMPVRFLIYLAEEYQVIIDSTDRSMYGNALIALPTPQCIVFYNGIDEIADESWMYLSDAYTVKEQKPSVEVSVRVININHGHNQYLMESCGMLDQYSQFVAIVRQFCSRLSDQREAMNRAIDYCIEQGILEEILRKNRSEILGSILYEFDEKKYERTLREEGREAGLREGHEAGLREGHEAGLREGHEVGLREGHNEFILYLITQGKSDEEIMEIVQCTREEVSKVRAQQG